MHRWSIQSTLEEWNCVEDNISDALRENGFDDKFVISFELALEEAFANISMYAYGNEAGAVEIELEIFESRADVTFTDYGVPFNPLEYTADGNCVKPASERSPGGLGIFIIKQQVDNVEYIYDNNANILKLKKQIREE